jgi:hypothetical protein
LSFLFNAFGAPISILPAAQGRDQDGLFICTRTIGKWTEPVQNFPDQSGGRPIDLAAPALKQGGEIIVSRTTGTPIIDDTEKGRTTPTFRAGKMAAIRGSRPVSAATD